MPGGLAKSDEIGFWDIEKRPGERSTSSSGVNPAMPASPAGPLPRVSRRRTVST